MLNLKNNKSELKSSRHGARGATAEPDQPSSVVLGEWEALSIAVMAQITAPLRARGATRDGLLGV